MTKPVCVSDNKDVIDQSSFWDSNGVNWDAHRIGWAIAGSCTVVTLIISIVSVGRHCRSYTNPREQRQMSVSSLELFGAMLIRNKFHSLRILYMPPVYAIISFFSYRFFRSYTYYSFIEVAYEAVTLSAFLFV
ncbi:hypothetical protein E4T56_gene8668, partial [Termitomyces sp. T112]